MEVNFRTTKADVLSFYRYYYFRRFLGWRVIILIIAAFWIPAGWSTGGPFIARVYLLHVMAEAGLMAVTLAIYYWIVVLWLISKMKAKRAGGESFTMTLSPDGFKVTTAGGEIRSWRWENVKEAGTGGGYVFIWLFHGRGYLIPTNCFASENDAGNFAGIIRNGIEKVRGNSDMAMRARRLRWWGLVGIVPNFGVIAGIILFFRGISFRDRWLVVIGVADILFTVAFWNLIEPWEMKSDSWTELFTKASQNQLNTVFRDVEFCKLQHGVYPDSLSQLARPGESVWIQDPLQYRDLKGKSVNFFYEKVGDRYWLFSVGPDHKPFTKDDIFPQEELGDTAKFGLLPRR